MCITLLFLQIEKDTQATQGTWIPEPGEDPLIAVLGPEHPGRTRGVGHTVGLRKGLVGLANKKRKSRDRKELEDLVQEVHAQTFTEFKEKQKQNEESQRLREAKLEEREAKLLEAQAKFEEQQREFDIKFQMVMQRLSKNDATPNGSPGVRKSSCGSTAYFDWVDSIKVILSLIIYLFQVFKL